MTTNKELHTGLYGYDARLNNVKKSIAEDKLILASNRKEILDCLSWLAARETSLASLVKYAYCCRSLGRLAKKPFASMNVKQVQALVEEINASDHKPAYKRSVKLSLKRLFQSVKKTEDYPPETAWIRIKSENKNWRAEALLTEDEIKAMINACMNDRDRAFISGLYYSDCRIERNNMSNEGIQPAIERLPNSRNSKHS